MISHIMEVTPHTRVPVGRNDLEEEVNPDEGEGGEWDRKKEGWAGGMERKSLCRVSAGL